MSYYSSKPGSDEDNEVMGPVSSTDNAVARWDGTTGETLQNSSVTILDNGNTGIGTTNPTVPLEVYGGGQSTPEAIFRNTSQNTVNGIGLYTELNASSDVRNWGLITDQFVYGDFSIQTSNARGGNPFNAGTPRLYIAFSGNVGIGTTGPGEKLEVTGNIKSSGSLVLLGKVTQYNSINTTGQGIPSIYGTGRSTGQTAAVDSVVTYTVGVADGSFIISSNMNVTGSTTHAFSAQVDYTDETNTSRTVTLSFSQLAGSIINSITNVTGVGPYEGIPLHIRCKASTSITMKTVGTFTSVVYNVEGSITQIA